MSSKAATRVRLTNTGSELNDPRLEVEGFSWHRLEVDFLLSVFPAKAGIQVFVLPPATTLDALPRGRGLPAEEIDNARLVEGYCSRFCSSQIAGA